MNFLKLKRSSRIASSFNIASFENVITGVCRATFINPAPNTNYVLSGSAAGNASYNPWFQERRHDRYPRSREGIYIGALTVFAGAYKAVNVAMSFQVIW